jgi:hypothetical protein
MISLDAQVSLTSFVFEDDRNLISNNILHSHSILPGSLILRPLPPTMQVDPLLLESVPPQPAELESIHPSLLRLADTIQPASSSYIISQVGTCTRLI